MLFFSCFLACTSFILLPCSYIVNTFLSGIFCQQIIYFIEISLKLGRLKSPLHSKKSKSNTIFAVTRSLGGDLEFIKILFYKFFEPDQ